MDPIFVKKPKTSFLGHFCDFLGLNRLLWKIGLRYIPYFMTDFM